MADSRLVRRLDQVVDRLCGLRRLRTFTWGLGGLAILLLLCAMLPQAAAWTRWVLFFGVPIWLVAGWVAGRRRPDDRHEAAALIERAFPDLDARLITAMQQQPRGQNWNFSYLQTELLDEVFEQWRHKNWFAAIPDHQLRRARGAMGFALAACVALSYFNLSRSPGSSIVANGTPVAAKAVTGNLDVLVEPGNADLERGTSLLVIARFPKRLPATAELVTRDEQQQESRIPLRKSLDDPLFGGRIPDVQKGFTYFVEFDGQRSDEFRVTTFEYPALLRADAHVKYPEYTTLPEKTLEDIRQFSIVEGSQLDLQCLLNKPVTSAVLVDAAGQTFPLTGDEAGQTRGLHWTPAAPGESVFTLQLVDAQGRKNREPPEIRVNVLPNLPPDLRVAFPGKDMRVTALQEVPFLAEASDDFGLQKIGFVYELPNRPPQTVEFDRSGAPEETVPAEHLLALESLDVNPDDLVSYYFFADDVGPDGTPRRTTSDIFFAEVRPFDEAYRQVPVSHGPPGEMPCLKILELQRKIVAGAWNVIRHEPVDPPSTSFGTDVRTLGDSQEQVRELTERLQKNLDDTLMQQYAAQAIKEMNEAISKFRAAVDAGTISIVPEGRSAAQAAYQSVLKLQSREKCIKNCQGNGQCPPGDRQLDEQIKALQLKNDRDRYESERAAKRELTAAQRELLDVLNRLRELSRRQEDLNERIRELENSLRLARTDEERAELDRQLKRLQEEQKELLRNVDELRERMNKGANRQQLADARRQMDETRERVMRAAEALEQSQTSKALTEATRAERQLQDLTEQFRKATAGQFREKVQELRDGVRELAKQEAELAKQLQGTPARREAEQEPQRPSLRDSAPVGNDRDALAGQLEQQQKKLAALLEQLKELVQEAETNEPLLSKKLYDAARDMRRFQPEEALANAARMTRFGIRPEAQKLEQQARTGIDRLQAGVEEAARGILGDETEALKLAQAELRELTEAIRQEMAQNRQQENSASQQKSPGTPREGESSKPGQQASASQKPGQEGKPSERPGNSPGQSGQGARPGTGNRPGSTPSQSGQGQQPGQGNPPTGQGQSPGERPSSLANNAGANSSGGSAHGNPFQPPSPRDGQPASPGNRLFQPGGGDGGGTGGTHMPLTGGEFLQWSDRLRDVEEMMTTPELRAEVASIRDQARLLRVDIKRHSKAPDWELVRAKIYGPLRELENQIAEELARRDPQEKLIPVDRDPVPEKYAPLVREYYEQLSRLRNSIRDE